MAAVSCGQLEAILGAVSQGSDIALETLRLVGGLGLELAQVSPDILAGAAVKLTRLALRYPTSSQVGEILTRVASSQDNKLRVFLICVGAPDISELEPKIVAGALLKLENTGHLLHMLRLSPGQINHLFTQMKDTEVLPFTRLDLNFGIPYISEISPEAVAGALAKLEEVYFVRASPAHLQAILSRIQLGGTKLRLLKFRVANMSAVTSELLLGALRMVRTVWLSRATFTTEQVTSVLSMLNEGSQGKLKKLKIFGPDITAEACNLLKAGDKNNILEIDL